MTAGFAHLHAHSHYSFLDGASSPETLARRAADLGQGALALTDWHGLYGAIPFDRACRDAGVHPLFGAEIALAEPGGTPGPHLTLLVRNQEGWRSLCRLLSAAQLAGGKGHAPVARALLAAHPAGLICLSGCRNGALAAPLLAGDEAGAWAAATWPRDLFGDDLWVEVPRNDRADDGSLGRRLSALAGRLGMGIVATANVHYASVEEGPLADTLACIRNGTTLEAARHLRPNHRHHLASGDVMAARYRDLPAAVANTAVVAAHCAFALDHDRHTFPAVTLPPERTPDTHLRALCRAGLTARYADGESGHWRRAIAQLDHELGVIERLGLAGWDGDEAGERPPPPQNEAAARMRKYVGELATYIANNAPYQTSAS